MADQVGVALVVGVDGQRGVAEDRLRARRGDGEMAAGLDRIAHIPEVAVALDVVHLFVGEGGLVNGAPVDEVRSSVDEAFGVEANERLLDGADEAGVHRESGALPIRRHAEAVLLLEDDVAVFLFPCPHTVHERLAPKVVAALALRLLERLLHHVLRGDARVVEAGHPQRRRAAHPVVAGERVLHGVLQGVAHVQAARHVGRRHHHHERLLPLGGALGVEDAGLVPVTVPLVLDLGRGVGGGGRFGRGRRRERRVGHRCGRNPSKNAQVRPSVPRKTCANGWIVTSPLA